MTHTCKRAVNTLCDAATIAVPHYQHKATAAISNLKPRQRRHTLRPVTGTNLNKILERHSLLSASLRQGYSNLSVMTRSNTYKDPDYEPELLPIVNHA